jgi:hypothetical protein
MNKEQIIRELTFRSTQKYLIYLSLQEIMLDYYEDCKMLKDYDHDLTVKHKNMVSSLKRNATKAYRFLQSYEDGEETIKQFHDFVKVFEALHMAIDQGGDKYSRLINDINSLLFNYGYRESENDFFPKPTQ